MTLQVELPDALAEQARALAARERISVDALIATALAARLEDAPLPGRPTIAERSARVDWPRVDAILARVPATEPAADDAK